MLEFTTPSASSRLRTSFGEQGAIQVVQADELSTDRLHSQSLVELAVSRLREDILAGALVPGERLVEEQLTKRFQISRAPLREALRLLGEQGLVEHLPRRGARVTTYSDRDFDELFAVRDTLEHFASSLLARRPREELTVLSLTSVSYTHLRAH